MRYSRRFLTISAACQCKEPWVRRFVDLSIYLENEVLSDPPAMKPNIDYITHDIGAQQMAGFFPGASA